MTNEGLFTLTLLCPSALENRLADWLLAQEDAQEFMSTHTHTHRVDTTGYTLKEQVRGKQNRVRFDITLPRSVQTQWLTELQTAFPNTGIHYQITNIDGYGLL